MKLESGVFQHMTKIPKKFTCQGLNISPELFFKDVSEKAKSLVLIMEDPDVPLNIREDGLWVHWILYNLPATLTFLKEGNKDEGTCGLNTGNENKYMGPCPPDGEHRYFFKLYALDFNPNFKEGLSKEEVMTNIENHVIDRVELLGLYEQH